MGPNPPKPASPGRGDGKMTSPNGEYPAEQICRQMLWETRRFVGLNRRTDDTTMVVVKVVE